MKPTKLLLAIACVALLFTACKKDPKPEQVAVSSISLNKTSLTLGVDAEETLIVSFAPENASDKTVNWSSSKTDIATVDGSGKVKALAEGETVITATSSNGKTATCTVNVIIPIPAGTRRTIEGIDCVYIPAGTFLMGSPKDEPDRYEEANGTSNEDQHSVTLTKGFWMGEYEIINVQFCNFLNAKLDLLDIELIDESQDYFYHKVYMDLEDPHTIIAETDDAPMGLHYNEEIRMFYVNDGYEYHPMKYVSWYGANEFAKWIGGALPTEAQWEYACRGGQKESLPFGIDDGKKLLADMANFCSLVPYDLAEHGQYEDEDAPWDESLEETGIYSANAWGLHDMHGNVFEWCSDWYGYDYYSNNQTDPTGPASGEFRIIRGGSYESPAGQCRSAYRTGTISGTCEYRLGFRIIFPE